MYEKKSKKHVVFGILLVAIMLLTTIPAVTAAFGPSAVLLTPADPTSLHQNDLISIQVNNLAMNDHFKYRITSSDLQTPSKTVTLTGVNMPFAFKSGTSVTTLTTSGVTLSDNPMTVKYAGVEYTPAKTAGTNTVTAHQNIKAGIYDVTFTALTKTSVNTGIDYTVEGDLSSAVSSPATLSFNVANVETGHITVEVLDNGASLFAQQFTITVPVQNGGSDGPSGPSAPSGPAAGPQLAPPGFAPSTATLLHNDEGKVLADYTIDTDPAAGYSGSLHVPLGETVVDSKGKAVSQITITPLDTTGLTGAPVFAFECEPSGTQFSGGVVTFTFTMTDAQWQTALIKAGGNLDAMTVGYLDPATNTWVSVPAVVDPVTHSVTAHITHFSIYALFIKATNEVTSTSPQTYGSLVSPTPVSTIVPISTPAKTMQAPPSTTQSPGLPGLVVVGVVGLVGLFIIRKKQ